MSIVQALTIRLGVLTLSPLDFLRGAFAAEPSQPLRAGSPTTSSRDPEAFALRSGILGEVVGVMISCRQRLLDSDGLVMILPSILHSERAQDR